jgi:enamine deaminase RidA (YjgF/YER057c/UK114 family)
MIERHHSASPFEEQYGFCRAIRVEDAIEVAGTAPIPQDGGPTPEDAYRQMLLCGEIATQAIRSLGGAVEDVVRTRMFIVDPADADAVGKAHHELFSTASPAATMVVVAKLLDPSWKVEIEVTARVAGPPGS